MEKTWRLTASARGPGCASASLASTVSGGFEVRDEVTREMAGEMEAASRGAIAAKGFALEARRVARTIDMRYAGQNYELPIAVPDGAVTAATLDAVAAGFHKEHARMYGFAAEGDPVQLITFRVEAHDSKEKIGEGTHVRAAVEMNRFMKRVRAKSEKREELKSE